MNQGETKLTGLFFGSFDPIHLGHLIIAEYLLVQLEEIWFVLSPQNPLKTEQWQSPAQDRLSMLQQAIASQNRFRYCDMEFHMPPPHFTHRTLQALKAKYPARNFSLIIGSDNLEVFDKWKDYQQIMDTTSIIVYPRPGNLSSRFTDHPNIQLVQAPLLEISSTYIRNCIAQNKPCSFMLTPEVLDYIKTAGLYK